MKESGSSPTFSTNTKIFCKYLLYSDLRQQNLGFGGMLMKIFERIVNEDNPPKRWDLLKVGKLSTQFCSSE